MVVGCGKDIEVAVAKLIEMREEAEGYFSNLKKKKEKLLLS